MSLAVVILNWNGKSLLERFLPSVIEHSKDATIYVADNASTDGSVNFVKANFPSVNIIQNTENGGYAKGYNEALKEVKEDIFCLLNSDVEVTKNWLTPILETFKAQPKTAIIQPKILDFKNKNYFEYAGAAGGFIDKLGYPYCRGRIFNTLEKDEGQFDDIESIFWASGACLFVRKTVFIALGGFDESFFAHMEEIDLCWRARNNGYNAMYVGTATVYHVGGATLKNTHPKKTFLNFRNSLFALAKNAKGNVSWLIINRLLLDGVAGGLFLVQLKFSHCLAILKAHFSFYVHLPTLLNFRRRHSHKVDYYTVRSIVWRYFIKRKTLYKTVKK